MDDALARQADVAGIEPGYWDGLGVRRDLSEDTARALLAALGVPIASDGDRNTPEVNGSGMPPYALVDADDAQSLGLTIEVMPAIARRGESLVWRLELATGEVVEGHASLDIHGDLTHDTDTADAEVCLRADIVIALGRPWPAGCHRLLLSALQAATTVVAAPRRCHVPEDLAAGARCWGLAVQLYAVRSARNWGMGDFTDLANLATLAGRAGAALLGLNPLHARHLARPEDASPYAPSSRLMLDPLYLDVEALPEYAASAAARAVVAGPVFQQRLERARAVALVDHVEIAALKLPVLRLLFDEFRADPSAPRAAYDDFVTAGGATLRAYATFEALRLALRAADGTLAGWRDWPACWRDAGSAELAAFADEHAADIAFQCYLQWRAEQQLGAAAAAARAAGMRIGLYRDLAVGAADDGAESWADPTLFAPGVAVGAPPDLLNREGQNWGLPPWNPHVLAARAGAPLAAVLAANMRHAGALRIDHVMSLTRLFWIPAGRSGDTGGYVRYPFDLLAAVVALESAKARCMVIGEDLGSVPDGLRDALAARGLLSYRVLLFERHWDGDGSFKRPWEYPAQALATVVTHDMPPIAEYWRGDDVPLRAALGLYPEPALAEAEAARREPEREGLRQLLDELGLRPASEDTGSVTAALHAAVGRTAAMLAVVQLDDICGETTPVNVPGTWREYPNWQRKLGVTLEALADDSRWLALAADMRTAGR